ncbi:Lpx1 [Kluyveromyces lactis]|nr:Lpx1 [Kluyveromyces lactis]
MIKSTKRVTAAVPRTDYRSTLSGADVLEIVYDVYEAEDLRAVPEVNIVFLHGTGMTKSIWEWYVKYFYKQIQADPEKYQYKLGKLIAVDQVNHGDSCVTNEGKLGSTFHWIDGSKDIIKICDVELNPPKQNSFNVLIGHSMGGHQALGCGILSPNLFQLIITMEPVVKMLNPPSPKKITLLSKNYFNAISNMVQDTFATRDEYEEFMRKRSFWRNSDKTILDTFCDAELIKRGSKFHTKTSKEQHLIGYMCLHPYAYWLIDNLKWIESPVICYVGGKSKWCPPENYQLLRDTIPHYKRIQIDNVDHLMNIENPNLIGPMLLDHITEKLQSASVDELHNNRDQFEPLYKELVATRVVDKPKSKL